MKKCNGIFSLVLALLFVPFLKAQELSSAEQFLQNLHKGALLVRLQDRTASLAKIEERGFSKEAEKLRQKQYLENKETILSFSNTFTFCEVYFFYAKDSEKVRDGQLQGVIFNANQQPVPAGEIPQVYYTAEFSETSKLGITGLIIMDEQLIPLEAPLPHYERKYILMGLISRSKANMAEAYNEELWNQYNAKFTER